MDAAPPIDRLIARARDGELSPLTLIAGDLVLAEAAGVRLATALAEALGGTVEQRRRPTDLGPLVDDLQTFSLFGGGKVVLVVDSAVLGDKGAAAEIVGEAFAATPVRDPEAPSAAEREAAARLLQALHLFGIDPQAGDAASVLERLPDAALTGNARASRKAAERREALAPLLEVARSQGLEGVGREAVGQLADVLRRGLPKGHVLILAERTVAADHPLVAQLRERGALIEVARLAADRQGWGGLDALAQQLEAEVGVPVAREALQELARRTLRQEGRGGEASAASTARFAAEYRKLAQMSGGAPIGRELVEAGVEDRGEEDVWQLLDAIAEGRRGDALGRLGRMIGGAADPIAARLSFFGLLAGFCRQLVAVQGVVARLGVPPGERSYPRFRDRFAGPLAAELPEGLPNPLAGVHPFRLHRAYLAVARARPEALARLPWQVLETEVALKGESDEPEAALAALLGVIATALGRT